MLTESFVTATLSSAKSIPNTATKDVGIHIHDLQPTPGLKSSFKKSSAPPNCLAVSASHIFAAQSDKAIVHVYSRERGNQETTVPFPERIHSLALIGSANSGAGILALGTQEGRIILWELCTGRQISTTPSHLQPVTTLAVDPSSTHILSGSADTTIQIWSIPAILSFSQPSATDSSAPSPRSPLRSLTNHRAAITHLIPGHSSNNSTNIAVSASADNTVIIWDYHTATALRTILLPSTPLCLALDPVDRACYIGYEDGSVHFIDFYRSARSTTNTLHDPAHQTTPSQARSDDRWPPPNANIGAILCMDVSFEGTTLVTGHQSGKVVTWDVAKGRYAGEFSDLSSPVTSLHILPPTGLPYAAKPTLTIHNVVKPRYETILPSYGGRGEGGAVPASYNFSGHFTAALDLGMAGAEEVLGSGANEFDAALGAVGFPTQVLDEGIAELEAWSATSIHHPSNTTNNGDSIHSAAMDILPASASSSTMALDGANDRDRDLDHNHNPNEMQGEMEIDPENRNAELANLKRQLAELNDLVQVQHRTQKWTWEKLMELNAYRAEREERERTERAGEEEGKNGERYGGTGGGKRRAVNGGNGNGTG